MRNTEEGIPSTGKYIPSTLRMINEQHLRLAEKSGMHSWAISQSSFLPMVLGKALMQCQMTIYLVTILILIQTKFATHIFMYSLDLQVQIFILSMNVFLDGKIKVITQVVICQEGGVYVYSLSFRLVFPTYHKSLHNLSFV